MEIEACVSKLGDGPLTEDGLREHIWPLFSRVLAAGRARNETYLANHSLGRPLDQTSEDVTRGLDIWYSRMDDAWEADGWPEEFSNFRQRISKLIGLSDPKAVVSKTSAGQGLRAVLNSLPRDGNLRPVRVVAFTGEFDSIDFILKTYAHKGRVEIDWVKPSKNDQGVDLFESQAMVEWITPDTDLVVLSKVCFNTGQIITGIEEIIRKAHASGALVLSDAYHAAGVIPLDMERDQIDFMIGGSYKYTRGGPGACWLAIHPQHLHSKLSTLDTGWFAKKEPFAYDRSDIPERANGGDGWMESTPPVLTYYQAAAGMRLTLALGIERLREYNLRQQAYLRAAFLELKVPCFRPADPDHFGAFTLVPSDDAKKLSAQLKEIGVTTDSRGRFVRFGPDILNSQEELAVAARKTADTLAP